MKFVVIYLNRPDVKVKLFAKLLELSKQIDLSQHFFQAPLFKTQPDWPSDEFLDSLPLHIQCEHLHITKKGKIRCLKAHVIDIELVDIASVRLLSEHT